MSIAIGMHPPTQREISRQACLNGIYALTILILLQIGMLFRLGGFGYEVYENNWILNTSLSQPIVDKLTSDFLETHLIVKSVQIEGESGSTFQAEPSAASLLKTPMSNPTNYPFANQLEDSNDDQEQTITFNPLAPATFGDPIITLSATASSGLPITFESDNLSVATVSGNSLTVIGAGTVNITASQLGDGTYDPALDVVQVLTVNKAGLSALADNKTKIYGDPNPVFTITYTGFKGSDNPSVLNSPPTLATDAIQFSAVDSYSISFITAGTDNNYNIAPLTDGTFTITKAALSAAADNKTKTYGDPNPALTITYSGLKGSDDASLIDTPPLLATDAIQFSPVDLYSISFISEGIDNDYDISTLTDGELTINTADQVINFQEIIEKTIFDPPFALIATSTSGLPVTFASSNNAVISISGTTATIQGIGSAIITASQQGNINFNPADNVMQDVIVVSKMTQSIAFEVIPIKTLGGPSFTIFATSTSGLNIVFDPQTSNISVDGNHITLLNAGRAIIRATQPGDNHYEAAESVLQSFCVNPPKPSIVVSNANTETPTLTSNASSGNQWFLNGNPISGATNTTFNATEFGSYTVRSTVEDCASEISNQQVIIISGDLTKYANTIGMLYPVPARKQIFVSLIKFNHDEDVQFNIWEINGKEIYRQVVRGGAVLEIDIAQFNNGLYLIKVEQGQNFALFKFIKE